MTETERRVASIEVSGTVVEDDGHVIALRDDTLGPPERYAVYLVYDDGLAEYVAETPRLNYLLKTARRLARCYKVPTRVYDVWSGQGFYTIPTPTL